MLFPTFQLSLYGVDRAQKAVFGKIGGTLGWKREPTWVDVPYQNISSGAFNLLTSWFPQ